MTTTRSWRTTGLVAVLLVLGLAWVGVATPTQAYADTSLARSAAGVHLQQPQANERSSFGGCPLLLEGQTSPCVARLQSFLNAVNDDYDLPETEFFGPATRTAVLDFQGRNRLPADGNVGRTTARKLEEQAGARGAEGETGSTPSNGGAGTTSTNSTEGESGSSGTDSSIYGESEIWNCIADAGEGVVKVKTLKRLHKLYKQGAKRATLAEVGRGLPPAVLAKILLCVRHGPN